MTLSSTVRDGHYHGSVIFEPFVERCVAAARELRARASIRRSLGKLSDQKLRDVGLIRHDLETACWQSHAQSAATTVEMAALRRSGNW